MPSQLQAHGAQKVAIPARWPTVWKVQAGFIGALACLSLVGVVAYTSVARLSLSSLWVEHTHEVLDGLQSLSTAMTAAETAERGYVISGKSSYLDSYQRAAQRMQDEYRHLRTLTLDNTTQQRRLRVLQPLLEQRIVALGNNLEWRKTHDFETIQGKILDGEAQGLQEGIGRVIVEMSATEEDLLRAREIQARRSAVMTQGTIVGGCILALAVVAFSLGALRRDFAGRHRAERELRAAKEQLEVRVKQRTAELARANDFLSHSERRFRAFVGATSDVVYRMSPDWAEMYQLHGQDFIADTEDPSRKWLDKYIPPQEQPRVSEAIREAILTKKTFVLEHRVLRVDGTVGWTFSRAIPLVDDQGEILEWFGAASDVTHRKQAEDRLQAQLVRLSLLGQITRAIGEHRDVRSIFQVVLQALEGPLAIEFCCICPYDQGAKQLTVARVGAGSALLAAELGMAEQAHIAVDENGLSRAVRGQLVYEPDTRCAQFPFAIRLAQGGLSSLVVAPLLAETHVFGVLIMARREAHGFSSSDCEFLQQLSEHVALASHQAALHEALQSAYDDLRQTQRAVLQHERLLALGTMASGIAHDINNAISPIALYADSLLEHAPELTADSRHQIEIIRRSINDVAQTVARLREFYRNREAQQRPAPVELNRLVPQVIDLTRARWSDMAQRRGVVIEMRAELAPGLPAILGFEGELRDTLTNLIFNAVDAMPSGGQLTVRTHLEERASERDQGNPTEMIQLEVVDTGVGMDEETLGRCFEPFFTTKGERGTGLGLALVYGTLQRHGGDIDIQSSPGRGTTVRLTFAVPKELGSETSAALLAGVSEPLHILLVDDDPLVLESLRLTLEKEGHRVTLAEGGQAGIDAFRCALEAGEPISVVITDLGMPYVDGRAVSQAIKRAAPETRVVMLTGWGQRLAEDGDIPEHVDRVLSKPPKLLELREALVRT